MPPLDSLLVAAQDAEAAYAAEPGTATLLPYLRAWDMALLALDADTDLDAAAAVAHRAAVAHLQAHRRLGGDDHAEIAESLLERLRRHAPEPELAFAAAADLATLKLARYLAGGGPPARLRAVVAAHEDALRRCPDGFGYRPVLLGGLGNALVELARRDTTADVLDRAVALRTEAVAAVEPGEPLRTALLVNLATALVARYQRFRRVADLDRATAVHAEVGGEVDEQVLIARAELAWERYAHTRDLAILDEIVAVLGWLVDELPTDVPAFAAAAGNLANALLERQVRTGVPADVDGLLRAALEHAPAGERARLHHVWGAAHWQAYQRTGDLSRLTSAVAAWAKAVELLDPRDAARPGYLNSLAVGYLQRHAHLGEPADLAAAVRTARRALRAGDGTPVAAILWNTLGHALAARHHRRGRGRDLDEAITAWRRAVALAAPRERPSHVASLAGGLRERAARRGGTVADLVEAVGLHRQAVAALAGSQELPGQLANLGMTLHGLAVRTVDVALYREASEIFAEAVELGLRLSPGEALRAGLAWQAMAADSVTDWPRVAEAGDGALRALWALLAGQLLRTGKESWLRTCAGVAATTAVAHLATHEPQAAVAALEGGRALLLDGALPVAARLATQHPELVDRYHEASAAFAAVQRQHVGPSPSPR